MSPMKKCRARTVARISLKKVDDIARRLCRLRGTCEALGQDGFNCSSALQWAHIVGRSYHSIRWDEDNCLLLCSAHHWFYTNREAHWQRFLAMRIGPGKYEELKRRALIGTGVKVNRLEIHDRLHDLYLKRSAEVYSVAVLRHSD